MVIRKAIPGEGAICDALLTRLIRLERQWEPNLDETFVVSDNYEVRMAEDGTLLLVAEEAGEIVGFFFGFFYPSPVHKQPVALADAMFVRETHRGKGIGKALLSRFKDWAREQGASFVELKVMSQNAPALALYESLGFGEIKKYLQCPL